MSVNYWDGYLKIDYCYNCKGGTQRDYNSNFEYDPITKEYFIIAECHTCKKKFLYMYKEDLPKGKVIQLSKVSDGITKVQLITVFPKYSVSKTDYVPLKIADTYNEALRCIDNNAPNGAAAMFRRALQQICVERGARVKEDLEDQIKVLPPEIRPTATELRKWGNLGAHEDRKGIVVSVEMKDVELAKEFLESIFLVVYEHPAKLKQSKKKRLGI